MPKNLYRIDLVIIEIWIETLLYWYGKTQNAPMWEKLSQLDMTIIIIFTKRYETGIVLKWFNTCRTDAEKSVSNRLDYYRDRDRNGVVLMWKNT